jgi:hypothetical protein
LESVNEPLPLHASAVVSRNAHAPYGRQLVRVAMYVGAAALIYRYADTALALALGDGVPLADAVTVAVRVDVRVRGRVGRPVLVLVGVPVELGVSVAVGVGEPDAVDEPVAVAVPAAMPVSVGEAVSVGVAVRVPVADGVSGKPELEGLPVAVAEDDALDAGGSTVEVTVGIQLAAGLRLPLAAGPKEPVAVAVAVAVVAFGAALAPGIKPPPGPTDSFVTK